MNVHSLTFWSAGGNIWRTFPSPALRRYLTHRLFPLVAILAVMLASLRWIPITPIIAYAAVFISSSLLYWTICRQTLRGEASDEELIVVLLFLLLIRASFLGMDPLGSDDVYRYMWDGRVQAAGINPYTYAPNDEELARLHTSRLPSMVNHPEMKTIYFPLTQWIFYVGYHLSGESVWGFQLLILLAEVLTVIGLLLLLRELRSAAGEYAHSPSPWHVLIYAANPLVILQFSLDAHVDALGFPFLIFGLLFYNRKKTELALIFLGFSLLIKPVALVILPILFLRERGYINKAKVILLPAAVLLIPFVPYALTGNPFEALTTFSKHWLFNGALFSILFPIFSDNQTTRLWCFGCLAILLILLYMSKRSLHEKSALAVLLLLLCSPVAHPWYMGWLVVLLPLAPISSGVALAGTASLTSITFVTYQLHGTWKDYPLVLVLEYVPVVALLLYDLWRERKTPGTSAVLRDPGPETSTRPDLK